MPNSKQPVCGFCGKPQSATRRLVAGPGINICNECVRLCGSMLDDKPEARKLDFVSGLVVPKPHEIHAFLDRHVIGQDHAKKVLSVAVHNHYKRLKQSLGHGPDDAFGDVDIEKSNIVLIGPTGSGKTLLARSLAKLLNVPFAIADATTLTEAGYVGEDVENILLYLIQNAGHDVSKAETGIIYIDEIDKIGRKTENVSITRDVSGEGVQQALLKILEGTVARVPPQGGRKHPQQQYVEIRTEHILFICGGAFVGLEQIVNRRIGRQRVGFGAPEQPPRRDADGAGPAVEPEDLIRYGMIPEFVGRLPIITSLSPLTEDDMVRILVEPRNCLVRQYQKLLAMEGITLTFADAALRELARMALKRGTGARGLRAMVEELMLDVMFEAPRGAEGGTIRVTRSMVERRQVTTAALAKARKIA